MVPVVLMLWVTRSIFLCVCTVAYLHKSSGVPSAGEVKSNWLIYLLSLELTPISGTGWNKERRGKKNKSWRVAVLSRELTARLHRRLRRASAADDILKRRLLSALPSLEKKRGEKTSVDEGCEVKWKIENKNTPFRTNLAHSHISPLLFSRSKASLVFPSCLCCKTLHHILLKNNKQQQKKKTKNKSNGANKPSGHSNARLETPT